MIILAVYKYDRKHIPETVCTYPIMQLYQSQCAVHMQQIDSVAKIQLHCIESPRYQPKSTCIMGYVYKDLLSYLSVSRGDPLVGTFIFPIGMCAMCPNQIDIVRNDESHQLFAGP